MSKINGNYIRLPFVRPDHRAEFWTCYAQVDNRRPFFFPLVKESQIQPEFSAKPWFSFILFEPYHDESPLLLDFSNFTGNKTSHPILYHNNNNLNIQLRDDNIRFNNKQGYEKNTLYIESDNQHLHLHNRKLTLRSSNDASTILITLVLTTSRDPTKDKETYKCHLRFFRPPGDSAGKSVLDFGSEASQYGFIYNNVTEKEIFTSFQHLYNEPLGHLNDYWQHDYYSEDDPRFFRTRIFYSKQKGDNIGLPNRFQAANETLIYLKKVESDKEGVNDEEYLPNLKLLLNNSDAAGDLVIPVSGNVPYDCHDQEINSKHGFWQLYFSVMRTYLEALIREASGSGKRFLHIKILLPNTINQQTVQQILFFLHVNVEEHIRQKKVNEQRVYSQFEGFELECLPESDANLLGFLAGNKELFEGNNKKIRPKDYILSIDCGNGTTDVGIYEADENAQQMVRILRTGIAAAGNYLTFAVAVGLLDHFIGKELPGVRPEEVYTHFFTQLSKIKSAGIKDTIWQKLHNIKKGYSSNAFSSNLSFTGDTVEHRIGALLESLRRSNTGLVSGAESNIEAATIDRFVNALVKQVLRPVRNITDNPQVYGFEDFNIKHLMISGRGSLFQPFLRTLIEQVRATCTHQWPLILHLPGGHGPIDINQKDNIDTLIKRLNLSSPDFKNASIKGLRKAGTIKDNGFLDYLIGTSANTGGGGWLKKLNGNKNSLHNGVTFHPFIQNAIYSQKDSLFIEGSSQTKPLTPLDRVNYFARFDGFNYTFFKSSTNSEGVPTERIEMNNDENSFIAGFRAVSLCPFFIGRINHLIDFIQSVAHSPKP